MGPWPSAWSVEERRAPWRPSARVPLTVGPLDTRLGPYLVREPPSRSFGLSLSHTMPELALRCLFGDLEGQVIILKSCRPSLVTVPSAAPIWSGGGTACGAPRSPVLTESISEHLSVVTGIGAEGPGTMATLRRPYLPRDACCWTTVGVGEDWSLGAGARATV